MNDLSIIDRFTNVFSQYIDSGFGLLGGEIAFLTATLVVIDVTLAGLFWAMGGQEDANKHSPTYLSSSLSVQDACLAT